MRHIVQIIIILFSISQIYATNNVEVKVELSNVDCQLESSHIYMDIFIRKGDISDNIYLENQNYRFEFNSQTLLEGSFFIENEGDVLSGFNSNPDGSAYIFGEHHLTGSLENILSYNIDFQGGTSGLKLNQEWILVGTIGATLLTNIECIGSDILTVSSFPSTTLIYTHSDLPAAEKIIDQDPMTYNMDNCIQSFCNLCSPSLQLMQGENDYVSGEILEHKVSDLIEADNTIGTNAQVTYNVKNSGILKAGFEVHSGASFKLLVEGCDN